MAQTIRSYRDLKVWQAGMDLAVICYNVTKSYPRAEQYGLVAQIRSAAAAVPANIAEGYGRGSRADYARFVSIALGSASELETHLMLSERVGLVPHDTIAPALRQCDELSRMLFALIRSLRNTTKAPKT